MKSLRVTASTLVLLFPTAFTLIACTTSLFAQTGVEDSGVIPRIHRFQPPVPREGVNAPQQNTAATDSGEISASALAQIDALEEDKESRTPTQQKISSHLIYTARMLQGQPAAPGVSVLYTNLELDDQNNMFVDISAYVSDELLQKLRSMGVRIIHSYPTYRSIRAFIPANQLEAVAGLSDVLFISPRREAMTAGSGGDWQDRIKRPVSPGFAQRAARVRERVSAQLATFPGVACAGGQGSFTSEGYLTHRVNDACSTFGVTGAGVKIGVLSDGVKSLAASQSTGDLPPTCPAGPPCITVLAGQDGVVDCNPAGTCDEGTAMLEIIHDLAPNAQLYFATAFGSLEGFAQNIRALRDAGCDIIVDDVFYFVESPFQDGQAASVISTHHGGVVTQAINDVAADGALYFTSAGNNSYKDGGKSQTFEGDFVDGGTNSITLKAGKVQKFGTTAYNVATATFSGGGLLALHWSDPLGGSANDYDLYVLNSTGTQIVASSTDFQTGTQDPEEGGDGSVDVFPNERVVVFKATAAASLFLHLAGFGARFTTATQGAISGHSGATGAFAVGATPANLPICPTCPSGPFPGPFTTTDVIEPFSSDGPRRIFFQADGTPITPGKFSSTGGRLLQKPEFTAADGVSVTGVGGFGSPFYGTSASAPHAAAIAGLIKSLDSSLSNSEIAGFLTRTAIDIMGAGTDRDSGAGIIMAFQSVRAATAPKIIDLAPPSGVIGGQVTISGKNFGATQSTSTVTFNGTPAITFPSWSDTTIKAVVPAGTTNGNVVVTVTDSVGDLVSNGIPFTLTPSITGLSANSAPAGASLTITGTNFGATKGTSTVTFNGTAATVTTWSMTSIVVNVPTASTGKVVVAVNTVPSNGIDFTMEDYSVPAKLADVSVTAGGSDSQIFTFTPSGSFDATVTFSCSNLPSKSTCTFTPATVPPGAVAVDVTMKVSTAAPVTSGAGAALLGTWLPMGGFGLVLAMGVGTRKRSRKVLAALVMFLLIPLLLAITSCGGGGGGGGGSHTTPGTPLGTYNMMMKATSGPTSHAATFKLTVK